MKRSICRPAYCCLILAGMFSAVPDLVRAEESKWEQEVGQLLRKRDEKGALEVLDGVTGADRNSGTFHNLKGAVFTQIRDFARAKAEFTLALKLAGDDIRAGFHPKFNLAELAFVTGDFEAAGEDFKSLLKAPWRPIPKPGGRENSTIALLYFKVAVCQIRQAQNAEAAATYRELKSLTITEAKGAAEAVLAALDFEQKKVREATARLDNLSTLVPQSEMDLYMDTYMEMGWLRPKPLKSAPPPPPKSAEEEET